jgi:hypothetical protein
MSASVVTQFLCMDEFRCILNTGAVCLLFVYGMSWSIGSNVSRFLIVGWSLIRYTFIQVSRVFVFAVTLLHIVGRLDTLNITYAFFGREQSDTTYVEVF